ncbi:MAG TPA: hypothetical protein VIK86_00715 [Candidatus Paceibacterota bacterium]
MSSYLLDKQFESLINNNSLYIFHNDYLTSDRSKNNWDNKFCVPSYDAGLLSAKKIIKIIKCVNIEVFVFFTFQSDLDKLIWKICQLLKIPTILHDHGIVFGNKIAGLKKLNLSRLRIRRKIFFSIKQIQLIYVMFLINNKLNSKKKYSFDYYLIYSTNNLTYYQNFFILTENNTSISGIPLFLNEEEFSSLRGKKKERKLLYLHQPFIKFSMSLLTFEEEINYINEINEIAINNNLKLEIRLHPAQSIDEYQRIHWNSNISFENMISLELQSASAYAIMGHWSTALAISYPFRIPLIILEFPKTIDKYKQYYSIFKNVSYYCENIAQFKDALYKIQNSNNIKYNQTNWEKLIGTQFTVEADCIELISIIKTITNVRYK